MTCSCRQAGVPGPPGIPDRAGPDCTGSDVDENKDDADLNGCQADDIPLAVLFNQVDDAGHARADET